MKEARITINLSEYEGFNRTIQKKDEYITQCVNNGKIKRNDIHTTIFYQHMGIGAYDYHQRIRLLCEGYEEYLTDSGAEEINNDELRKAITEIRKYKKEWEADFKEKSSTLDNIKNEIRNKSWVDRLVYLFTGEL